MEAHGSITLRLNPLFRHIEDGNTFPNYFYIFIALHFICLDVKLGYYSS